MAKVPSAAAASGFAKSFASWGLNAPLAGAMDTLPRFVNVVKECPLKYVGDFNFLWPF